MPVLRTPPLPAELTRGVWQALGWTPHSLQEEILLSGARNKLVSAGRRFGKSESGGYRLIPEAFRALKELDILKQISQRREYWIVGPEYSDSEKEFRRVWNGLEKLGFDFDRPGSYNNPLSGEMHISMWDGRFQVHAKSAKYPGTLVGEGLSGVVFAEAAKLKPSVWHKFLRPTLADFQGFSYFGSTPEGRNWFYDLWSTGQDAERKDWGSWRAPSWSNPHVYPLGADEEALKWLGRDAAGGFQNAHADERRMRRLLIDPEILSLFDDMSMELFNQEIAALFTEFVGRVFGNFDEEYHVTDDGYRPDWATYGAMDYGFTAPTTYLLIQVDPHGERFHILDEYYERGKTNGEAGQDIMARGLVPAHLRTVFGDPAEPGRSKELSDMFRTKFHPGGSIPVVDRVEWIRRLLKGKQPGDQITDGLVPQLTINRRCTNLIREMDSYRYPETFEKSLEAGRLPSEKPRKGDDHCIEAFGRFISGFLGSPYKNLARSRQSTAKVGRR